jgi:carbonic anhydrase
MNSLEAQQKLIAGNRRFINNEAIERAFSPQQKVVTPQKPFAIILGCSDSRVPIETIFNQSFGDLFIIRIAGNIVAPSQIGSIEFAVSLYDTPLVVVLGHTHCGAISAAINEFEHKESLSDSVNSITDRIKPLIEPLVKDNDSHDALVCQVANANITQSVLQLKNNSNILAQKINNQTLSIIGAKYSLQSGKVDFF